MSLKRSIAIAKRIIQQFVHDRRTLGLIVIVPILLLSILGALFKTTPTINVGFVSQDTGMQTPLGNQKLSQRIESLLEDTDNLKWHKENLEQAKSDIGFSVGVVKAMFPNTLAYSSALERIYFEIKEVQDRLSKEFIQKE